MFFDPKPLTLVLSLLAIAGSTACAKQPAAEASTAEPGTAQASPPERTDADTMADAPPEAAADANAAAETAGSEDPAPVPIMDENGETRTTQVVADYVKAHREEVRTCYDELEKKYPGVHGDIVIRFVIAPGGDVQSLSFAKDKSTLNFSELADCMMTRMKGWQFPPSSLGMESRISYPFNFNPKRPD